MKCEPRERGGGTAAITCESKLRIQSQLKLDFMHIQSELPLIAYSKST